MHTYLSYFPTSLISKFSSPFISYAGLGIYSTISSCAGCNTMMMLVIKVLAQCKNATNGPGPLTSVEEPYSLGNKCTLP